MVLMKTLFFLLLLGIAYSVSPPKWSETYTVKGTINIPYAELVEPFNAWYDKPGNRSRIDYYGGMVKSYQLATQSKLVYVHPYTSDTILNAKACDHGFIDSIQSLLPDLTNFKYAGNKMLNGNMAEKWEYRETFGDKTNNYKVWLVMKKSEGGEEDVAVPIRYESRGYSTLFHIHFDYYYLDYEDFDYKKIDDEFFKLDDSCDHPYPGKEHQLIMNPMAEFIHPHKTDHVDHEFDRFRNKHGKEYENEIEHSRRKDIFRQSLRLINSKNRANLGYTLSINHLADRTDEELTTMRGRIRPTKENRGSPFPYDSDYVKKMSKTIPENHDWRLYGAVTPVKDQTYCGSCWTFGSTGAVEGAFFLKNGGHLVRLSEQALVDCTWGYGNNGCYGGLQSSVFKWIMKHGGIPSDEDYGPYLGKEGYCHADNVTLIAPIKDYVAVTPKDPDALRLAIFKHGPISVSINASPKTLLYYSNGVYSDPECDEKLNHAVLAVGYGKLKGEDYILVKNSWSNHWGNAGYILISPKNNTCGILNDPSYVVM